MALPLIVSVLQCHNVKLVSQIVTKKKKNSLISTHVNSTITFRQTGQQTGSSSSLPHFSIFFLLFYTSDVQNIIASVRKKNPQNNHGWMQRKSSQNRIYSKFTADLFKKNKVNYLVNAVIHHKDCQLT